MPNLHFSKLLYKQKKQPAFSTGCFDRKSNKFLNSKLPLACRVSIPQATTSYQRFYS